MSHHWHPLLCYGPVSREEILQTQWAARNDNYKASGNVIAFRRKTHFAPPVARIFYVSALVAEEDRKSAGNEA